MNAARPVLHFGEQQDYTSPLPFHPPERYPELDHLGPETDPSNGTFAGVRRMLLAAGYDAARRGTPQWSPLSDLAPRGGKVVLKPNFVRHYNETHGEPVDAVVTHLAVLRPLVDYAWKAVGREGQVILADAPQYDCEVEVLLEKLRMADFLRFYNEERGLALAFRDLRVEFGRHAHGIQTEKRKLAGDPEGYVAVDLGDASEFAGMPDREIQLIRGADYDEEVTIRHHSGGRNEYLVSRTVLGADLVVNVPKIKTHKKAGITLSMKNLIGINGDKNWLPHYRLGFQNQGGDEFPRPDLYSRARLVGSEWARKLLKRGVGAALFRRLRSLENAAGLDERTRAGNWHGNDTIWRTCIDLNRVLYHADAEGRLGTPRRRVLNVYDGVVAGEGPRPHGPRPAPPGPPGPLRGWGSGGLRPDLDHGLRLAQDPGSPGGLSRGGRLADHGLPGGPGRAAGPLDRRGGRAGAPLLRDRPEPPLPRPPGLGGRDRARSPARGGLSETDTRVPSRALTKMARRPDARSAETACAN